MQNIGTKVDGVSVLPAAEFNSINSELQNIILSTAQTLSGADNNQISRSMGNYVAKGDFYTDSGVANAYVLTIVDSFRAPTSYTNGFRARFKVGNNNTGAATVNVASLGVKTIKKNGGADDLESGDLVLGRIVELTYDLGNDCFILFATETSPTNVVRNDVTTTLEVGYTTIVEDLGNSGTGTITPLIANGSIKRLTINGSFTLAAPTDTNSGYIEIEATNDATGGYAITITAFDVLSGTYDSAANAINLIRITKIGSNSYLEFAQPQ